MISESSGASDTLGLYGCDSACGSVYTPPVVRALIQRVSSAAVSVEGKEIARIARGMIVLLGIGHGDGESQASYLAEKIANLRIFEDETGKMNLSMLDIKGEAIVVSQFTLFADTEKGRRPAFTDAALPDVAEPLVARFVELLAAKGVPSQAGRFGAHMLVEINNDGPVTIWLEKK